MKYTKIAAFIKKAKHLSIHTRNGSEQWISDGTAAYPVLGMPVMSEKEMLTFLNFQENDPINVIEWKAENIDLSDVVPDEQLIESFGPSLNIGGEEYSVFYTSIGALLVREVYLVPAYTHYGEGELTFYLRYSKTNNPYIVVKKGFYPLAAICPFKTWGIGDTTLSRYEELCRMLALANENMKETEDKK